MKGSFLLFGICWCLLVSAQKIQYSRQTIDIPYADGLQLVADINGYHHLLCFNSGEKPVVYIFDSDLRLYDKKEIPVKLSLTSDIRIITFKNFYYFYIHSVGSSWHELFKVDADGSTSILSKEFQSLIGKELTSYTSTLQLTNHNEQLYVVSHTYYEAISKTGSTIMELNKDFQANGVHKVFYNFDKGAESIQQSVFTGRSLLILKNAKNNETGNSIEMMKIDISTGKSLVSTFSSGFHLYTNPSFYFDKEDSTILLHSMVLEPLTSDRSQRTVFVTLLNDSLQELNSANILRSQFRDGIAANYLLAGGKNSRWFYLSNSLSARRNSGRQKVDFNGSTNLESRQLSSSSFAQDNHAASVRLTLLNEDMKPLNDSVIANNKNYLDVQPGPFAQARINNKACLFLNQNFSTNNRGIIMFYNRNGKIHSDDIRVYDKYNYLLPQMQTTNDKSVILPYSYKNEIGLVRIGIGELLTGN